MATDLQVAVRKVASVNPASGEILREIDCACGAEVQQAVSRARSEQTQWAALDIGARIEIFRQFQPPPPEKQPERARVIARDAGNPYVEALFPEVLVFLDATRFLIENARSFLRAQPIPHGSLAMKTKAGRLVREPRGVIGIISPWNYPL